MKYIIIALFLIMASCGDPDTPQTIELQFNINDFKKAD